MDNTQTLRDYWNEKVKSKLEQQTTWMDQVKEAMDQEKTYVYINTETDSETTWLELWCKSHQLTYLYQGYWDGSDHARISW